jgi:hypothetical protein
MRRKNTKCPWHRQLLHFLCDYLCDEHGPAGVGLHNSHLLLVQREANLTRHQGSRVHQSKQAVLYLPHKQHSQNLFLMKQTNCEA